MSRDAQVAAAGARQAAGLSAEGGPADETAAVAEQAHRAGMARGADGVSSRTPRQRPLRPVSASPGTSRVVERDGARKADLAAIHVGKKALNWDDGFYRDMLHTLCRVRSAADLDFTGRKRVLAHMQACGWAGGGQRHQVDSGRARKPWSAVQRKAWSLWQQLADAGLVDSRKTPALNAWLKRQTGVERIEWLKDAQADMVIESLKRWLVRAQPLATAVEAD